MENLLTFCVACVHSDAGEDVFIWFKVIWLCSGWGDICLWSHSSWRDASPWGWELFLHFSWHKWLLIPRKGTCYLSLSLYPLFLSLSVTHWQHVHTDCISSVNDSVNVPHQRMSHSTTLLLWWFLPSVYYIMQQRVLLSYIRHNKHSLSALI